MTRSGDPLDTIKQLYYGATKATIGRDLEHAIDLLKALPDDEARERAAVYMDGLSQMRSEWGVKTAAPGGAPRPKKLPAATRPAARPPARRAR